MGDDKKLAAEFYRATSMKQAEQAIKASGALKVGERVFFDLDESAGKHTAAGGRRLELNGDPLVYGELTAFAVRN